MPGNVWESLCGRHLHQFSITHDADVAEAYSSDSP
jgi:hypothetical protein